MEKVKLQIEVLKIKLTFFSALSSGLFYLFLNIDKLQSLINLTLLYIILFVLYLYAILGVFINLTYLSDKYKDLEAWK